MPSACSTVWNRAGPLKILAALRVSGIWPSRPNGLVQSKPALAPVRRPSSDGSMVMPSMPCSITRSWSAWKRVPIAHSHLALVADVDVLVEHIDVLQPHDAAEQSGDDRRLASPKARWRMDDAQRVRAAGHRFQVGSDRLLADGCE